MPEPARETEIAVAREALAEFRALAKVLALRYEGFLGAPKCNAYHARGIAERLRKIIAKMKEPELPF